MRRILAIVDSDADYGKRLAAYINSHDKTGFKATAFSDAENYRAFRKNASAEILLITEELARKVHEAADGAMVILLSEDGFAPEEEKQTFHAPAVFKYQSADRLSREIMNLYADDEHHGVSRAKTDSCEIIGIYSPVNRCGKTTLAITLGLVRAERGKTLLLSLEEYAGVFTPMSGDAESDLSDVIYCFLQGAYSWSRLKGSVYSFGKLDFIPPVRCIEDISEIPSGELGRLIRKIADDSGYSTVILDFGSFGRRAADLLDLCGRIFMPVQSDALSDLKIHSFTEYLEKAGKSELKERLVKCVLPFEKEKAREYARASLTSYLTGTLYAYAETMH